MVNNNNNIAMFFYLKGTLNVEMYACYFSCDRPKVASNSHR